MSGTPANNPVKVITAKRAHDALAHFEENLGKNLRILRDEPVVRNVGLRSHPGSINSINLMVRSNLEALFVQLTGKMVTSDCQICKEGKGPFTSCVQHPKVGYGSCANCLYRRQTGSCTHRVSVETDSDDLPLSLSRKRQAPNVAASYVKKTTEKQRRKIWTVKLAEDATTTATQLEEPMPVPAFDQQRLQSFLEPTPAPTPLAAATQAAVNEEPIHGPGTALGSAADHWLKSLAFSKYASPAPTQTHFGNDYASSSTLVENNRFASSQVPVALRDNEYRLSNSTGATRDSSYAPSLTSFRGNGGGSLDNDASKPLLAYMPRNVSPEVLRSIAQFHQDLADDLRMEAKRLEREMRQERECDRGRQAARQTQYE